MIVILVAFVCVYPIYFTVIASFSDAYEVYSGKTFLLPKGFNIMSYELVFQNKDIWIGYANTILYTVLGTLLNIFLTIPAAYALSRPNILGQGILMKIFLRLAETAKFIVGERPLEEVDNFWKELETMGVEEYIEIYREAYAPYLESVFGN